MSSHHDYEKTGYLNSDFKIFSLSDTGMAPVDFHFHDFHKILVLQKGNVSYCVEGRTYPLLPGDIVFVPAGEVHRPILKDCGIYERVIIYISRDYLAKYKTTSFDPAGFLQEAHGKQTHVLRIPSFDTTRPGQIIRELKQTLKQEEAGNELYQRVLFLEFIVLLGRACRQGKIKYITNSSSNPKILQLIDYLNEHLTEDITIDQLSDTFYISRYHLMHLFKEETGCTIGNYLTAKRLLLARDLIRKGSPITSVCYECGFHSYSAFSRAYKKQFGYAPKKQITADVPPAY